MEALELKLTTLGGVGWPEAMNILAEEHEERTGNKVVLNLVNWPLLDTVLPALAAGDPPDVYHDHSTKFFNMFAESTVLTLNPYVETADWSPDDLSPMDMQAHTWVDGSIKGVISQKLRVDASKIIRSLKLGLDNCGLGLALFTIDIRCETQEPVIIVVYRFRDIRLPKMRLVRVDWHVIARFS